MMTSKRHIKDLRRGTRSTVDVFSRLSEGRNASCVLLPPLWTVQRREAYPQQPDLVARSDHVAGADPHGYLLDLGQVLVKLGQQAGGGVLLEAQELPAGREERSEAKAGKTPKTRVRVKLTGLFGPQWTFCRRVAGCRRPPSGGTGSRSPCPPGNSALLMQDENSPSLHPAKATLCSSNRTFTSR